MQQDRLTAIEAALKAGMLRGLAGDAAGYRAFLAELGTHLRAFFRKRLYRTPDDVEDLVQETLIAVHNQRHTYDPAQPVTAWAYAIARYKLIDLLRRQSRGDELAEPLDDAPELGSSAEEDAAEARRDLARLLAALPAKQRDAIACVKLEGLSVAETAERTGLSEPAVKVSVHRGLKALAAMIRGAA